MQKPWTKKQILYEKFLEQWTVRPKTIMEAIKIYLNQLKGDL